MKKHIAIAILILATGTIGFAQKESGTIYSEHEGIQKTRQLWQSLASGDVKTYVGLLADSVWVSRNGGETERKSAQEQGELVTWFANNFENLKVQDEKPAFPDAMKYKEGELWVQDWLLITGRHKESGMNLNLSTHNLYRFDDKGRIAALHAYFNNDVFQEIGYSSMTRENGKVYINHPYINTVRKVANAYMDRDPDTYLTYFADNARFVGAFMEFGESKNLEEMKAYMTKNFSNKDLKTSIEEVGYPDCIYYEENNQHVVYSWWKVTTIEAGKKNVWGLMLTHNFNKDGKIVREAMYMTGK